MNTYRVRVERGARWLDENFPGWEKRVDPETLDLRDGFECVCGQVFAKKARGDSGYGYAFDHLFEQANGWIAVSIKKDDDRRRAVSEYLGFSTDSDSLVAYDRLQKEWKDLLTIRAAERILAKRAVRAEVA